MNEMNKIPLILVADDVPKNLQLLGNILKAELECEIAFATNGLQVLSFVREHLPDLILLDVMMPEMDGFETCRQLKAMDNTRDIPVIFLTARVDTLDIVKGFKLGAVDYVTKPFESVELMARVNTHLALKATRDDLIELNSMKDKFFSIISHDLKNPMGALLTLSELLYDNYEKYSPERAGMLIQTLYESSKSAFNLLENLLIWSRAQRGKLDFTPTEFRLRDVVEGTLKLLGELSSKKGIRIEDRVNPDVMVYADRNMLETVIRNLISNGIKFTGENGEIRVGSSIVSNGNSRMAKIFVSDNGIGMSPAVYEKLFRIDSNFSTPGTNEEPGTGLGLVLCSDFVKINGGEIAVESVSGEGSTFYFSVPLA